MIGDVYLAEGRPKYNGFMTKKELTDATQPFCNVSLLLDKPTSALEYLKNNFAGKEVEEAKQKAGTLESENRDLKKNVERLET